MRRPPAPGSDGPEQRSLEDKQPEAFAENPTLSAKAGRPCNARASCFAVEKEGIRRAEEGRPQCGVPPPRGAMARSSAVWKTSSPRPSRRIPPSPPRRSKVRFAPACFCLRQKNKPSARSLAPPLSQKVPLGAPVRLQAPAGRRAVATNFLRAARDRRPPPPNDSTVLRLVGAKSALLRLVFVCDRKTSHPPAPLLLLFRKKSRSARLYGCKRPQGGAPSLPTFCELRETAARLPQTIPQSSASSEQSPLCSGLFLSATEKQAIRPLPCSSSFAKSHARRACSVASALAMAYCRCQLFASYGSSIPISQKPKIPFSYLLGMYNDEKRPKGPDFAGLFVCPAAIHIVDS